MGHSCVWSQEGSGYPQVLSLVLGGDFERLASNLGELYKGCRRVTTHQQDRYLVLSAMRFRWSTARSLHNDLQRGTGVQISDQTVRNRLYSRELWSQCLFVGLILTPCHRAARRAFAREHQNWQVRHCAFHKWKSDQLKWIWRTRQGLEKHRGTLSGMQHRPSRQVWWWVSNGLRRHFLRMRYGPACT